MQATSSSSPLAPVALAARWKAGASRRHSRLWTVSRPSVLAPGVFASARLRAGASSVIVRLQSQIRVFIGRGLGQEGGSAAGWGAGVSGRASAGGLAAAAAASAAAFASASSSSRNRPSIFDCTICAQHRCRDRVGLAVVVDVDVQAVHHVEVRVAGTASSARRSSRRHRLAARRNARSRRRASARPRRPASAAAGRVVRQAWPRAAAAPAAAAAPPGRRPQQRPGSAPRASGGRPRCTCTLRRDQRDRKPSSSAIAGQRCSGGMNEAGRLRRFGSGR